MSLERISVASLTSQEFAGKIAHAKQSSSIKGVIAFRLRLFVWQEKKNGKREELENETDIIIYADSKEALENAVSRYNYLVGRGSQYSYLAGYKGWVRIDICYIDNFGSITYNSDIMEQKFDE